MRGMLAFLQVLDICTPVTKRLLCCLLIFLCRTFDKWCSAWRRLELQFWRLQHGWDESLCG